jgi:hypothetical protein
VTIGRVARLLVAQSDNEAGHTHGVSLTRFWFVFDLDDHRPPPPAPGGITIDGGTVQYRSLSWGAGVTAHDEEDALALLRDVVGAELPDRASTVANVSVDRGALGLPDFVKIGDPARRGVWLPAENLRGLPRRDA